MPARPDAQSAGNTENCARSTAPVRTATRTRLPSVPLRRCARALQNLWLEGALLQLAALYLLPPVQIALRCARLRELCDALIGSPCGQAAATRWLPLHRGCCQLLRAQRWRTALWQSMAWLHDLLDTDYAAVAARGQSWRRAREAVGMGRACFC